MSTPAPWLRATIHDDEGKPIDPVELFRIEKAKSRARNAPAEEAMRARVKTLIREQDARDLAAGRGGRPRKATGTRQANAPKPRPAAKPTSKPKSKKGPRKRARRAAA